MYIPRILDQELASALASDGAVLIEGLKASGKTKTALNQARSSVRLDLDASTRALAEFEPKTLLAGDAPRLIDEWQVVPSIWNDIRHTVDDRQLAGQFILTGSANPKDDGVRHSGAGRFSRLRMRTMTFAETGHSREIVSFGELLNGRLVAGFPSEATLGESIQRMAIGGWPSQQVSQPDSVKAQTYARNYLDQIARVDVPAMLGMRTDPIRMARLLRSLARNTSTEAKISVLTEDASGGTALNRDTVERYLDSLQRIFIVEPQAAWTVEVRSKATLRQAPKWHLADTSLAIAALRTNAVKLLGDFETLGLLFESQVVHDLKVFAQPLGGEICHYRDSSGLECDAIFESAQGWAAFEVKLNPNQVDLAAENLKKLAKTVAVPGASEPLALTVVTSVGPTYRRPDGVNVVCFTDLTV
jgi:predicted AAA+ superfamily ATPase